MDCDTEKRARKTDEEQWGGGWECQSWWRNHKTLIHSQGTSRPLVFGCQSDNMLITVAADCQAVGGGFTVASHNLYLHDGEGMKKQQDEQEHEEKERTKRGR